MHDLKKFYGTFKGLIGECMFKLPNKRVVLTRFFSREKYLAIFGKYFNSSQISFLRNNWYSLDAIEVSFEKGKQLILYEVKTKNKYNTFLPFKPKMTASTSEIYNRAKDLGFVAKIALIELANDWTYDINILDFDKKYYCIDKPKAYDAATQNRKLYKINHIKPVTYEAP